MQHNTTQWAQESGHMQTKMYNHPREYGRIMFKNPKEFRREKQDSIGTPLIEWEHYSCVCVVVEKLVQKTGKC